MRMLSLGAMLDALAREELWRTGNTNMGGSQTHARLRRGLRGERPVNHTARGRHTRGPAEAGANAGGGEREALMWHG